MKNITFTISCVNTAFGLGYRITTRSLYAEDADKNLLTDRKHLFDEMSRLADHYNNHETGCIGVLFDVE